MREFWQAIKRGTPITRKFLWRALEVLSLLSLIVGIITAPFLIPNIENTLYRNIAWGLFIPLVIVIALAIGLIPYWGMREMKRDEEKEKAILEERVYKLANIEELKQSQLGNEEKWLYLVVERIELGRRTSSHPEREIIIKFQFDSGLVYDFRPSAMWVSPILDSCDAPEPQLEIREPPNFLAARRSQLASYIVSIKDEKLWEAVKSARAGNNVLKELRVDIQKQYGQQIFSFRSAAAFYSDAINDIDRLQNEGK
ncbi:MAG TPA: hypothetical protein G4O18_04920 [Dehalococcoidia bacterium]|nr:hypothetical protein [Dehalococcoidia bacterium]